MRKNPPPNPRGGGGFAPFVSAIFPQKSPPLKGVLVLCFFPDRLAHILRRKPLMLKALELLGHFRDSACLEHYKVKEGAPDAEERESTDGKGAFESELYLHSIRAFFLVAPR